MWDALTLVAAVRTAHTELWVSLDPGVDREATVAKIQSTPPGRV